MHFERCTMASKNFDMVFIFKDYDLPPRMVSAVDMKDLDDIQEWLTQQVSASRASEQAKKLQHTTVDRINEA